MIRPATESDLSKLKPLFDAVVGPLEVYNERARESEMRRYSVEYLAKLLEKDSESVLLAEDGDAIAGFCITRDDDDLLWLSWYGVAPGQRGHGLGEKLLKAMIASARERGYWKVWCDSRDANVPSIRLLESVGFEVVCRLTRHWYGQDFVLMERFLDD